MELIDKALKRVDVRISLDELLILNNALNEVCHGLDKFEFDTRMGVSQEEVAKLLQKIGSLIDEVENN
ncbi:hypothetical protein PN478_01660 [Dolichospermum circinale CS-534/05]|uniref:hypothetical protein n=1 Tax=Dolichospermum circinale TaxID=109265 RepID=UPI0023308421|nr:hypothetical protein [Dolichospermum circinale]MDB9489240.1 hypothetical protein [Dolichospermum circinale CS-534/05]